MTSAQSLTYTYDALNRRLTEVGSLGTVASEYDLAGRRTKVTWPGGFYVNYDYDVAGNVTAVRENGASSGAGLLASFTYDSLHRRTGTTWGNGVANSYGYDAISRLSTLTLNPSGTAQDQTVGLTYNRAGQIAARESSNEAYTRPAPSKVDRAYEIDGQNRVKTVHNYKTGANSSSNLTYDGNANLGNDGTVSFTYDNDNRLISGNGATLSYDPAGRLSQVSKGTVTRFLYDGADIIGEYDASGSTLLRRYVHGAGTDVPLVWYEGSGTGDRRSLLADERGSVVAVTNSSGTASINSYNEYGQPGTGNQGRFQYTGQIWLAEVGVYHYKARAYSPSLGRFLQPDPIGYADGMNLYAYVGNDPVNRTDPTGMRQVCYYVYGEYADHDDADQIDEIIVRGYRYLRCRDDGSDDPVPVDGGGGDGGSSGDGQVDPAVLQGDERIQVCQIALTPDGNTKGDNPRQAPGRWNTDLSGGWQDAWKVFSGLIRLSGETSWIVFPMSKSQNGSTVALSQPNELIRLRVGVDYKGGKQIGFSPRIDVKAGVFELRAAETIHFTGGKGNMCPTQ